MYSCQCLSHYYSIMKTILFLFFKSRSVLIQQCQLANTILMVQISCVPVTAAACHCAVGLLCPTVSEAACRQCARDRNRLDNWLSVCVICITCRYHYISHLREEPGCGCLLIFHWKQMEIMQGFQEGPPLVDSGVALCAKSCMVNMVFFFMHPL